MKNFIYFSLSSNYNTSMKVNPGIFKSYDVRGVYPLDINKEVAFDVARGFMKYCLLTIHGRTGH